MPTMILGEDFGEQPAAKTASAIKSVKRARTLGLGDLDSAEIIIITQGRECRQSGVRRFVTISRRRPEPRASKQWQESFYFRIHTLASATFHWNLRACSRSRNGKSLRNDK